MSDFTINSTFSLSLLSAGISHMQWGGHNYFLSWREPWHKFEDWDWFNGRNFCRDRCMDLVSFDKPGEHRLFSAIARQGQRSSYNSYSFGLLWCLKCYKRLPKIPFWSQFNFNYIKVVFSEGSVDSCLRKNSWIEGLFDMFWQ